MLLTLPATSRAQGQERLVQLYRDAVKAEQDGNYPAAARLYGQILALRPEMAEAHANMGNLHYLQGKYDDARRSFQTAVKLKPQLSGPHFFLGVIAFRAHDLLQAELQLNKAAALDGANPQIQLHLGYTLFARGMYKQAISSFEKVIAADPNSEDAWYHLSKACSQESRRSFAALQQKDPDSYYTRLARAHFFEAQGSWVEAGQEYTKARELRPDAHWNVKLAYIEARGAGKEIPYSPAGEEIDGSTVFLYNIPAPSDLPTLFTKSSQTLNKGRTTADKADAHTLYQEAEGYQLLSYLASLWVYANSPDSYRAHQLKGQALEVAGRTDEAIAEYRKALASNPQLRSVHFSIGNLYWRLNDFDQASQELTSELNLNPNDPETHYELGDIFFTQSKLDQAASHFLTALQFAPEMLEAHLALERIYNSTGLPGKALYHLKEAARIAPAEATPHYRLWLLYRKQGRTADAEREREIFQKLKVGNTGSGQPNP